MSASAGGRNDPKRHSFGNARHQQCARRMSRIRKRRNFLQHAKEVRRLHYHRGHVFQIRFSQSRAVHLPRWRVANFLDFQSKVFRVCIQHLPVFRMHRPRDQYAMPPRKALRHQHSFSESRRTVIHRRVRHFLPRQLAHQRLKFENCGERALRNFRLIRRVGRKEFSALHQRVCHHRPQVPVNSSAQKRSVAPRILRQRAPENIR